ncbi:FAD-dependent oxidoreductase [Alphaproteobacteria bacterium]|nr:FAD-dependent oxidoreductase [Alphaproteobacteria bacterium]
MSEQITTDICVIGAGSGGLSVAAGAVQMGAQVVLVEGGKMGGDCLNYGCVPSKALLAAAHRAHQPTGNKPFGLSATKPKVNFAKVMQHVRETIQAIEPMDSVERFSSLGVHVVEAYGRFLDKRTLQAGNTTIRAKRFVIATGSHAYVPPIKGLKTAPYLTNETLFDLTTQPKHLMILGAGPIGVEMAQAFARLGTKVTLLETADRILGREDTELTAPVEQQLAADGVEVRTRVTVKRVSHEQTKDGAQITLHMADMDLQGDQVLVATGRVANIDKLNLGAAGIATTDASAGPVVIDVDARLRTSNSKIFAIGDVSGGPQFTHAAGYHAGIIIRNILFHLPAKVDFTALPRVTYSSPEISHVGLSEAQAVHAHSAVRVLRWPFEENDRARAERDMAGMVKVIVAKNGKILGASIVGAQAGDLLAPWTLAISQGLKISAMAGVIAPYPTRGEASKRAAGDYYTPTLFSAKTRKIVGFLSYFRR